MVHAVENELLGREWKLHPSDPWTSSVGGKQENPFDIAMQRQIHNRSGDTSNDVEVTPKEPNETEHSVHESISREECLHPINRWGIFKTLARRWWLPQMRSQVFILPADAVAKLWDDHGEILSSRNNGITVTKGDVLAAYLQKVRPSTILLKLLPALTKSEPIAARTDDPWHSQNPPIQPNLGPAFSSSGVGVVPPQLRPPFALSIV